MAKFGQLFCLVPRGYPLSILEPWSAAREVTVSLCYLLFWWMVGCAREKKVQGLK